MSLFPSLHTYLSRSCQYVDGILVKSETESTFVGSIQPLNGHDLQLLTEGRMDVGSVKIYSDKILNVSTQETGLPGDVVNWNGRLYEVTQALPYTNGIISHYKYIAQDVGPVPVQEVDP